MNTANIAAQETNSTILMMRATSTCAPAEADKIANMLGRVGMQIHLCQDKQELLARARLSPMAIVVLHTAMHASEDIHVLNLSLRALPWLHVMLLGVDDAAARARALYTGVDACLPSSAGEEEVIATILAMARRHFQQQPLQPTQPPPKPVHDTPAQAAVGTASEAWELNLDASLLRAPTGALAHLTAIECCILEAATRHRQRLLRHTAWDQLTHNMLPFDKGHTPLKVLISRLRSKVQRKTQLELPLRTFHGLGYQLAQPLRVKGVGRLPLPDDMLTQLIENQGPAQS